jgi:DNA polymerase III alpha subunit
MSYDEYGQQFLTEDELLKMIHINPELDVAKVLLDDPRFFNASNSKMYAGYPTIKTYMKPDCTIEEFDRINQETWHMPEEYKELDIVDYLVGLCTTEDQINRVAMELGLYDERNLIPLLQFLKYMIDTFRKSNVVWGVGRGSSVASYVLFLMGVHKTDSMLYELDVEEFLRPGIAEDK